MKAECEAHRPDAENAEKLSDAPYLHTQLELTLRIAAPKHNQLHQLPMLHGELYRAAR